MGNDHAVALRRKFVGITGEIIQAVRHVQLFRMIGCAIREIGIGQPVFVHREGIPLTVRRKVPRVGFPF